MSGKTLTRTRGRVERLSEDEQGPTFTDPLSSLPRGHRLFRYREKRGQMLPPTVVVLHRIDAYLADRTRARSFSGVVLVAGKDRVIFERAYGEANYEDKTPNRISTLFRIASMTKPLVAATALALVDRKELTLDAPICSSLVVCPPQWESVRLSNLLAFTSGVPDLFSAVPAVAPAELPDAVDAAIRSSKADDLKLVFPPGSKTEYSNFDYLLVGYAIQHAAQRSWLATMKELVLKPAGMADTRYDSAFDIIPGRARGYRIVGASIENTKYEDDGGLSAGGILSTAIDMYRFIRAYQADRFFSGATRALALTPDGAGFGYGWQITSFFGWSVQDFTGGTNGFSSNFSYYPQDQTTVVVMSNLENAGAKRISCDVGAIVHGRQPLDELAFKALTDAKEPVVGTYTGKDGTQRFFQMEANGLTYHTSSSPSSQMVIRNGPTSYALAERPDVVFYLSTNGRTLHATSCGMPLFDAIRD